MANDAEYHLKLMIGDLFINVAKLAAENEALREQLPKSEPSKKVLKP